MSNVLHTCKNLSITYSYWIVLNIIILQIHQSCICWIIETISGINADIFKFPWIIIFKSINFFSINFYREENLEKNIILKICIYLLFIFYLFISNGLFNLNLVPLVRLHCSVKVSITIAIDRVDKVELAIFT